MGWRRGRESDRAEDKRKSSQILVQKAPTWYAMHTHVRFSSRCRGLREWVAKPIVSQASEAFSRSPFTGTCVERTPPCV